MGAYKLVLAGGGANVVQFIGCLQYMEDVSMLVHARTFVGCSAGALMCFLLTLGLRAADIRRFLVDSFRGQHCHEVDLDQVIEFPDTWGVDDGNRIVRAFRGALSAATGADDMTFLELAKFTGRDLVVCVSNLTTGVHEFMCIDNTPELSVLEALRMSISIPLIFTPVHRDGSIYVDGGLFNNLPLDYCRRIGPSSRADDHGPMSSAAKVDTLALDIAADEPTSVTSFAGYLHLVLSKLLRRSNGQGRRGLLVHTDSDQSTGARVYTLDNVAVVELALSRAPRPNRKALHGIGFNLVDLCFDVSDEHLDAAICDGYSAMRTASRSLPWSSWTDQADSCCAH